MTKDNSSGSPPSRKCEKCGKEFKVTLSAPHKRFCSTGCRNAWWARERQQALASRAAEGKNER